MERYVLRGGRWGYDRLRILARVRRTETLVLLGRAGVGPGQRCVDLGSSSGEVSFELARLTAALADLAAFAADPQTVCGSPRTFQLWARRPLV